GRHHLVVGVVPRDVLSMELLVSQEHPVSFRAADDDPPLPPIEAHLLDRLPVGYMPYRPLMVAQTITLTLDVGLESRLAWRCTFADVEAAKEGEVACRTALHVLREAAPRALIQSIGQRPISADLVRRRLGPLQEGLRAAEIQRKGKTVEGEARMKWAAA